MITPSRALRLAALVLGAFILGCPAGLLAQASSRGAENPARHTPEDRDAIRGQAWDLLAHGRADEADACLRQLARGDKDDDLFVAGEYSRMAFQASGQNEHAIASHLARRALATLQPARIRKLERGEDRAQRCMLAASLYEFVLGDAKGAEQWLVEAVSADPANKSAARSLARLRETSVIAQRRQQAAVREAAELKQAVESSKGGTSR